MAQPASKNGDTVFFGKLFTKSGPTGHHAIPEVERDRAKSELSALLGKDPKTTRQLEGAIQARAPFSHLTDIPWTNGPIPLDIAFHPELSQLHIRLQPERAFAVQLEQEYMHIQLDAEGRPASITSNLGRQNSLALYLLLQGLESQIAESQAYWSSKLTPHDKNGLSSTRSQLERLSVISHPNLKSKNISYSKFGVLAESFLELPRPIREFVLKNYTIYLSDFVISVYDYEGQLVHGHGPNKYWDSMGGLHSSADKNIVVALRYYPTLKNCSSAKEVTDPKRIFRHEVGHAILLKMGKTESISKSKRIENLYTQDRAKWSSQEKAAFQDESVEEVCADTIQALLEIWTKQNNAGSAIEWFKTKFNTDITEIIQAFPSLSVELCNLIQNHFGITWPYDWQTALGLNAVALPAFAVNLN